MNYQYLLDILYLIASVTFVIGLKMLSHPKTARNGNLLAAFGMGLAIFGTIVLYEHEDGSTSRETTKIALILAAIAVGTVIGWMVAKKVKMTAMPEMVSLFNGMGGACAAIIALLEYQHNLGNTSALLTIMAGLIIGSVSFAGSMIAYGKLNGSIKTTLKLPMLPIINAVILLTTIGIAVWLSFNAEPGRVLLYTVFALSLLYGIMLVMPIGGADMPVVISLLNSFTGLAAALGGFLYDNQVMLTGGILVGSAGTLLTVLMCKAMNRSLTNVLIGGFGQSATSSGGQKAGSQDITVREIGPEESAYLFDSASSVIIVPGYGMAVAQAQHVVRELTEILEKKNITVKFAIHPVAGRMPGHMNVLLAEANVPYDKLVEMDEINDEFSNTDICLIIGANDVVNPAARTDSSSPIFGMPILNADKARTVIVSKRSMASGYAGIENELFGYSNCLMLFGDAKATMTKVVGELKEM